MKVPPILLTVTAPLSKEPWYSAHHQWTGRKVGFGPTPGQAVAQSEKSLNKAQHRRFKEVLMKRLITSWAKKKKAGK
jgi:hypothetical protein